MRILDYPLDYKDMQVAMFSVRVGSYRFFPAESDD